MNDYQKEYIEFRLILLGDSKVGKKSFIDRLLNISSTSVIRNKELELHYKKLIFKLRKKYEKRKKFLEDLQPEDNKNKRKEEFLKRLNDKTSRSSKSFFNKNIPESKILETKEFNIKEDENNFILKVTSDELYFSKKYIRPPIPEHPAKLFNIYKSKICLKPYYILPPEKIDFDYNPEPDDSENELDTEYNVSFKGVKNDVKKIILNKKTIIEEEKLIGYKITVYNIFLFLYDMSDFSTFEKLIKYYNLLENSFEISKMENTILYLIGNKKDKKILLDVDQIAKLNEFLQKNNFIFYEISIRSYFNFDKFFIEFIIKALSKNHQELIKEDNFKAELEKIAYNKPTFSKSQRETYQKNDSYIGPKYYANIYGFNSSKELTESFTNEKMRFNNKIFYNKIGPKYIKSKSTKDINININLNNINNNLNQLQPELYETRGGLLNRPIKGYQFGIVTGKLDLLKLRKKLISDRNESLKDLIEEGSSLFTQNANSFKLKGDEYLEEARNRKKKIYDKKIRDKKIILDKIKKTHLINLINLEKEKNKKNKKILLSQNKIIHSLSFPESITSSNYNYRTDINNNTKDKDEKKNKTIQKIYIDNMHMKNKQNLEEYYFILNKIKSTHKNDTQTPGPNSYDIRSNLADKNKGFTITGKRKELPKDIMDPSFPDLKDEFDIIISKATNKNNNKVVYSPRFKKIEKEKERGPYPNEEIWKKWELNKSNIDKNKIEYFIDNLRERKINQMKKVELIKKQTDEISRLRKEILIRKGYEDPDEIKSINYSQVETSSPQYSIKGRYLQKNKEEPQKEKMITQNINSNQDLMNYYIKNTEIFRPLPNTDFVKPKLPSVVFGKAERFNKNNKEYQGSYDLFPKGIFSLKTQENFSSKSPYDNPSQRSLFQKKEKSPSPADYRIKSEFEIIAEKGKKLDDIRNKIKIREMNFRSNKNNEKRYIKIKKEKNKYLNENDLDNNVDIIEEQENIIDYKL